MKRDFKKALEAFEEEEPEDPLKLIYNKPVGDEEWDVPMNDSRRLLMSSAWIHRFCTRCVMAEMNQSMTAARCLRKTKECPYENRTYTAGAPDPIPAGSGSTVPIDTGVLRR